MSKRVTRRSKALDEAQAPPKNDKKAAKEDIEVTTTIYLGKDYDEKPAAAKNTTTTSAMVAQQPVGGRRNRGLGLISHQDNMSQVPGPQESVPMATQSTSRKENNTTTGIVYTQSSAAHNIVQS